VIDFEDDPVIRPLLIPVLDPSLDDIIKVAKLKGIESHVELWRFHEKIRHIRADRKTNRMEGNEP
jgi:hypothetical protein